MALHNHDNNPYAKALEGLRLDDPVGAFFDFCREREAIRLRREKGGRSCHFITIREPISRTWQFHNLHILCTVLSD